MMILKNWKLLKMKYFPHVNSTESAISPLQKLEIVKTHCFQCPQLPHRHSPNCKNGLVDFVKIPVDFTYFLCLSPFHLKREKWKIDAEQTYKASGFWVQKLVCFLIALPSCLFILQFLRESFPKDSKNPAMHFGMYRDVLTEVLKIIILVKLWLQQNQFTDLVNFANKNFQGFSEFGKKQFGVISLCLLYTVIGLQNWIGRVGNGNFEFDLGKWWTGVDHETRKILFLPERTSNVTRYTAFDIGMSLIGSAGLFHRQIHC